MTVLVEAISVVARVATLEARLAGGVEAFRDLARNRTFCADGNLARVGFMTPSDVQCFIDELETAGLTPLSDHGWEDVAVIDQIEGPTAPCPWLFVGRYRDGVVAACTVNRKDQPGGLCAPHGWTYEGSLSQKPSTILNEDLPDRLCYAFRQGGLDIYHDRETGERFYVGRSFPDESEG